MISTALSSTTLEAAVINQPSPVAMDKFLTLQIPGGSDVVNDAVINAIATIRENIVLRRMSKYQCDADNTLGTYVHGKLCEDISMDGGVLQIGTQAAVVQVGANSADANSLSACSRKLAMHIVAANPSYLRSQDAPTELVEREKAIFREQAMEANAKKSPEMIEKIIQGKLNKRLNELSLLGQNHMVEPDAGNIEKYLKSKSFNVQNFSKWTVGSSM